MLPPEDHYSPDGSIATGRLSSAGRVGPLIRVGIMDGDGNLLPVGERGEIVVRGSLVMDGYYKNAEATAEAPCTAGIIQVISDTWTRRISFTSSIAQKT